MNDPSAPPSREPAPLARTLEAGVEIGDFRIERRLGAGGMGIVYQAQQLSLRRTVALKVLGQALTRSTDVARFQREAQAAARLKHPAIAQVYYIGQDRHICYLAMELVDGSSLRRVLEHLGRTASTEASLDSAVASELSDEPEANAVRFDQPTEALPSAAASPDGAQDNPYLSPQARELRMTSSYVRRVCEVIRDAAGALAHAHEQGVVHRDIKPDNLLLDRQGKLHLIDFGVARFFDDQAVTYTGQLVGTPLYMSPEQVTGRGAVDARTDTYSLGLVLYELLTLRPPIEATNRENLLRTIVTKPLLPVGWRNPAIPEPLQRIVHKATQKDPDQRYASASALSADLDRFLAGQAVEAPAYHFRLDEREVTAARPAPIVLAAMIFFIVSFVLFLGLACIGLMMGIMLFDTSGAITMAVQVGIGLGILTSGIAIGRGLLGARPWARWCGLAAACLLIVATAGASVALVTFLAPAVLDPKLDTQISPPSEPGSTAEDSQPTPTFSTRRMMIGTMAMYALPVAIGLAMGITLVWALLCRSTSTWFRFARQLREEHRQARMQMAA